MPEQSGFFLMTKNKKIGLATLALISVGAIFVILFRPLLVSIAIAAMLGLLIAPGVDLMEQKRIPRALATFLCLSFAGLIAISLIGGFVPSAVDQVSYMLSRGPDVFSSLYASVTTQLNSFLRSLGFSSREVSTMAGSKAQILSNLLGRVEAGLVGIWTTSAFVLSGFVDAALVPFFAFFLVKDRDLLHRLFLKVLPEDVADVFDGVLLSTADALRAVLRGQLILIAVDSCLYVALMTSLSVDGGVVLGVAAGLCRLVPYLDAITALLLGSISVLTHDGGLSVVAGLGIGVLGIQVLDGLFLTPRLVGGRAGLHPAVVIGTVLAFGKVFGIWGVIFAIPVAAIFKALLGELLPYYLSSGIYSRYGRQSSAAPFSWRTRRRLLSRMNPIGRRWPTKGQ